MITSQSKTTTQRIGYIDALRGFTMILVVMNHVSAYCLGVPFGAVALLDNEVHSYTHIFSEFRMPLFFFVSGFVLYKATDKWNLEHIKAFFKKKIPVQLLSPFLFFVLFLYINKISFLDGIFHPEKKGYWFTFMLLQFFVFYAFSRWILLKLFKLENLKKYTSIGVFVLGLFFSFVLPYLIASQSLSHILGTFAYRLYFYFILGTLTRAFFSYFEKLLDQGYILIVCVISFFILNFFYQELPLQPLMRLFMAVCGIVVVFSVFRKYASNFESRGGKILQFIGRRTLDIYLIHYFFIPRDLKQILTVFKDNQMPLLEIATSLTITLIVILACLSISMVLRLNPLMAHWLFGAKLVKNDKNKLT